MTLASLKKTQANRVLGIDASTNSIAFCLMENDVPLKWGKINLSGEDIYDKIHNAKVKMALMLDELKSDYIVVEGAVFVKSADAVIKLSYIYGVVLAELMQYNAEVITVAPISWQSYIGNKNLTNDEKNGIKITNPGKTDSWYKTKQREIRKQRTVDWVKRSFGIELDDFDVADAFGIAFFAHKTLTEKK